jgi:hypothetical protein
MALAILPKVVKIEQIIRTTGTKPDRRVEPRDTVHRLYLGQVVKPLFRVVRNPRKAPPVDHADRESIRWLSAPFPEPSLVDKD